MTAGVGLRLLRTAVFTAVCVTLSALGHSVAGGGHTSWWVWGLGCAVVFAVAAPLAGRERSLPGIAGLLAAGQVGLHTLFAYGQRAVPMTMPMSGSAPGSTSAHGSGASGGGNTAALRELAAQLLCDGHSASTISAARARRVVSDAGLDASRPLAGTGRSGTGHAEAGHAGMGHAGMDHAGMGHAGMGHDAAGAAAHVVGTPLECLRTAARAALTFLDGPMLLGHLLAALALGWLLRRGEAALWRLVRLSARSARTAVAHVRALCTALARVRASCAELLPDLPERIRLDGAREESAPRSVLLHHSVHRRGPPRQAQPENFALAA